MSVTAERNRAEPRIAEPAAKPASEVELLRAELERIDAAVVEAIARRCDVARRIGEAKQAAQLPVVDPTREASVVRRAVERAREAGVRDEGVRQLFWVLIDMARRAQLGDRASGQLTGCAVAGAER